MSPLPPMGLPQPTQSSLEQLKFLWIIVGVVVSLTVIYLTHWTYLRIRCRRTPQQQPQILPSTDFERNWGDAIPLQPLQLAVLRRRASDEMLPVPLYDRHANDQGLPPGVKLERRGSYHYVVRGDTPPPYTILEEPRSFRW
jgi:hypothetical protein